MVFPFSKKARPTGDDEKAQLYERDATRPDRPSNLVKRSSATSPGQHVGSFAPNPAFIRALRFLLYSLTSMSAYASAGVGLAVVHYYNTHGPVIKPSWGSLIAMIAIALGTPSVMFGLYFVTPRLFRHGGVGALLNQTRLELLMLFSLSGTWISVALAVACDLRGRSNCIWDGYYHYPKPSDFDDVCNLINVSVALSYTTFGLCALQMALIWTIAVYILLFLDQEVLTEPTNDMGGRAYRARLQALTRAHAVESAPKPAGSPVMYQASGSQVASSSRLPVPSGPAPTNATSRLPAGFAPGPMAGGRYRDEEGGQADDAVANGSAYYGYDTNRV
ncbi:hypothetical protein RQP46_003661 [Phenoliferia psychrophenolica]